MMFMFYCAYILCYFTEIVFTSAYLIGDAPVVNFARKSPYARALGRIGKKFVLLSHRFRRVDWQAPGWGEKNEKKNSRRASKLKKNTEEEY